MHEKPAILLDHVSKIYRLYGSQRAQLLDVLGLHRLGFAKPHAASEFKALDDISLSVPKGHRIGIIGRNGAGKTTLLKLICGNYAPTQGKIQVNGNVQALMNVGLGFHPEYTGMENLRASLQYNGLPKEEYARAIDDVLEFCELGAFIDQPFKTYSLGMQARLMFATATAIRPDILIIDEVLGAGDAYFIAKSKQRVERLVNSGATMLLVSHSTQQILELCKEAIWMHEGKIRMQGEAFDVVKAYEQYIYGASSSLKAAIASANQEASAEDEAAAPLLREAIGRNQPPMATQQPPFQPHNFPLHLPMERIDSLQQFRFQARGGLSRWESSNGIKFCGFTILSEQGETNQLMILKPASLVLFSRVEKEELHYALCYGVNVYDTLGVCVLRIVSQPFTLAGTLGAFHRAEMSLNPLQLGPGEYSVSISIHAAGPLEMLNELTRYDLLNRSFEFTVHMPDSLGLTACSFYHSAEWHIASLSAD
jgi:lipopolysaccharide transport system ATP-binding protein